MMRRSFSIILGIAVCLAIIFLNLLGMPSPAQTPAQTNSAVAVGRNGAVATVDPRATQVGIEVLRTGGNAIAAAVATAAALGVVEPFSAGIGGGGFIDFAEYPTVFTVGMVCCAIEAKRKSPIVDKQE